MLQRNLKFSGKSVRYIAGDEKTGAEIAAALGAAIGKNDLKWMIFSDEQNLDGMKQAGLSEEVAKNYVEMGSALRSGEMNADYFKHTPGLSDIKLQDFASEFKAAFGKA